MDTDTYEISPLFHITSGNAVRVNLLPATIFVVIVPMLLVHRTGTEMLGHFAIFISDKYFSFEYYWKNIYPFKSFLKIQHVLIKKSN